MCIRILLLLTVFGRRWCGNDGGIHYRSLFQNEASFHKCGNHLREQLFLQSVLDQQIAKTAKGIAVWTLIAGIDAAEIRKTHGCRLLLLRLTSSLRSYKILQQIQPQHDLQRIGLVAALSFVIARPDQA